MYFDRNAAYSAASTRAILPNIKICPLPPGIMVGENGLKVGAPSHISGQALIQ